MSIKAEPRLSIQGWASASALLMAVAATSKGLGFFREILIANYYGASGLVDAFSVAYSVPLLAAGGISFAFSMALLPRYHHVLAAKGKEAANCLLVSVNASCLVLSIVVMLPLWVMPDEVIHLAAPGLPPDGARLAGDLLRWLCLYVLTLNMVNLLVTTFHAFNHFKVPAFSEVAFNAVTILVLVGWASSLGIHALVLGNLLGNALCIGLLVGALTRNRAGLGRWYFRLLDLLSPVRLMIPIWGYALCGHMGVIIANYFASGLGEGSVAALGYARTASVAVVTLVTLNLARGMFPTLAALSAAEKRHEGRTLLLGLSRVITFVFVPASVLLVVFRKELLGILYLRGAFSAVDLETTSTVFLYFTATLVVAALEPVFVRTCFTFADSRTPLMTTLAGAVVMIPLMMVLTPQMGIAGIGLSAGLALLVDVSIQVLVIDRKFGGLFAGELIKCLARSTVYAAVALPLLLLWPAEGSIQALISAIVYVGGYYSIARYFSDDGVRALWLLWKKGTVSTG